MRFSSPAGGVAGGARLRRRPWPAVALAVLMIAAMACLACLQGCAPASPETQEPAAQAQPPQAPEHEDVTLRIAVAAPLQGVVEELADSYAAEREWLSFQVDAYASAKELNAAIAPVAAEGAEIAQKDAPGSSTDAGRVDSPDSDTSDSDALDEASAIFLPQADIVFQHSPSAMDDAEEQGCVDPLTRVDMLEDSLCLVVSADSKVGAVSMADIEAGSYPIAVLTGKSGYAKRQRQVLQSVGAMEGGSFAGRYAARRPGNTIPW